MLYVINSFPVTRLFPCTSQIFGYFVVSSWCIFWCLFSGELSDSTSACDCQQTRVSKMTYYVSLTPPSPKIGQFPGISRTAITFPRHLQVFQTTGPPSLGCNETTWGHWPHLWQCTSRCSQNNGTPCQSSAHCRRIVHSHNDHALDLQTSDIITQPVQQPSLTQ